MLPRPHALTRVRRALGRQAVTAILGPRQCGKTTLAREVAGDEPCERFDLEDPIDLQRLSAPMTALELLATRSMRIALEDLGLEQLFVLYPGSKRYAIDDRLQAVPLAELEALVESVG